MLMFAMTSGDRRRLMTRFEVPNCVGSGVFMRNVLSVYVQDVLCFWPTERSGKRGGWDHEVNFIFARIFFPYHLPQVPLVHVDTGDIITYIIVLLPREGNGILDTSCGVLCPWSSQRSSSSRAARRARFGGGASSSSG